MMPADPIRTISDAELTAWANRAYWSAARAWAEYRGASRADGTRLVRDILRDSALSEGRYWRHLEAEKERRVAVAVGYVRPAGVTNAGITFARDNAGNLRPIDFELSS